MSTGQVTGKFERGDRFGRVDDLTERLLVDIADLVVEEAGAHGAIGLDDGRDPGRVAARQREVARAVERAVVARQSPQLGAVFGDEAGNNVEVDLAGRGDNLIENFVDVRFDADAAREGFGATLGIGFDSAAEFGEGGSDFALAK